MKHTTRGSRTLAAAVLLTVCATLTACGGDAGSGASDADNDPGIAAAESAVGIPPEPAGASRAALLLALRAVAPNAADTAHEDTAIDAAREQCSAINGGASNLAAAAAARFSYDGIVTSPAQGKAINAAIEDSGFCASMEMPSR
ncbi:hypothetical protein G3I42_22285 [Streptomyces sp. SID11385]|nr:hypothetical protein [Streptomyces sp. SID11385]